MFLFFTLSKVIFLERIMQNVFTLMYMQVLVYLFQILPACREAPLQSLQASGSS